jgi:hypothetical protein
MNIVIHDGSVKKNNYFNFNFKFKDTINRNNEEK